MLLTQAARPAEATFPGTNGKIVFESNQDGSMEIYAMNPDGKGLTNLTNNQGLDGFPNFSPNGKTITFTRLASFRDPNGEIFVMNARDGSKQKNRTHNEAFDGIPDWGVATQ